MTIVTLSEAKSRSYNICVVGAGAAGLALACRTAEAGLSTLLVEQGNFRAPKRANSDDEPQIPKNVPHDRREQTNVTAVGGSLHKWGRRSVPFDPEDFSLRSITKEPGWPITYADYLPWLTPASEFLQCSGDYLIPPPHAWTTVDGLRADRIERLGLPSQVQEVQKKVREDSLSPDLLTEATVLDLHFEENHIKAISVTVDGQNDRLEADCFVLACGGLETTRLLLLHQQKDSKRFGGLNGPLGRYYMGHLTGSAGEIVFANSKHAAHFGYDERTQRTPFRRRISLTEGIRTNIAFWIETLPANNPSHRSGELSLKEVVRRRGRARHLGKHLLNIVSDPIGSASVLGSVARRLANSKPRPDRLRLSGAGPYRLAYHAEHLPDPESRVTLSDEKDRFGRAKLNIQFRYDDATVASLVEAHRILARRLKEGHLATLELPDSDMILTRRIRQQSRDGYHQIGMTRMSASPRQGVVNEECRVHGVDNLYIASASIFPVSGQANPTLSVVAFSFRIAEHLIDAKTALKAAQ